MDIAGIEKLDKLLKEGKISSEEYLELKKNLPEPPAQTDFWQKPWQVWVCAGFLFLAAVLIVPAYKKMPYLIIATVLNAVFGVGLLYRNRVVYIITMFFGILAIGVTLIKFNPLALLLNLCFCIILGTVWQYYFKKN